MSLLLALIALHGLETAITNALRSDDRLHVVVYADDFVVLHKTRVLESTELGRLPKCG